MTAGGNRNALNREVAPDGTRDWSFGLCSCFDTCCLCMCRVPPTRSTLDILNPFFLFPLQAAGLYGVLALFTARPSSVCTTCRLRALLFLVAATHSTLTASFMAVWQPSAMVGSCRYVDRMILRVGLSHPVFRSAIAAMSAVATISVVMDAQIVSPLGVVSHVSLRRTAGKLSWRRTAFKDPLYPLRLLTDCSDYTTFFSIVQPKLPFRHGLLHVWGYTSASSNQ